MAAPDAGIVPVKTCKQCASAMRATFGDLEYEREGYRVIVSGVPMSVCDECGERYIPGPIALEIDDLVAEVVADLERTVARRNIVHITEFRVRTTEAITQRVQAYA